MPTGPRQAGTELDAPEMDAWHGFLRTHAALVRGLDDQVQRAHGVSLTRYEVLMLLARSEEGSLRMSDLADGALLSLSGLSHLIDRLVAMGLVRRATGLTDRRGALAVLTPAGRRTFEETRPTRIGGVRRLVIDRLPGGTIPALGVA